MTTAETLGGGTGRIVGGWIGGVIGSFIPPPGLGTLLGRAVGSRLGGMAGRAAAAALQDHITSMESAEEEAEETDRAEGMVADSDTCKDCAEKCRAAAAATKHALYNNKRERDNPDGFHGYLNRMIEQMCGANGPGTISWKNHVNELVGAQRRLRNTYSPFQATHDQEPECDPKEFFSREEREIIGKIIGDGQGRTGANGWTPDTIPHKGRGHPDCQTLPVETARMRDYLRIIRPSSGLSGPTPTS